jgi:hypothetical protein
MTDNLSLPTVAASQTQKEVTINAATQQLSAVVADWLDIDMTSAGHTLSAAEFTGYAGFKTTNNSVSRTLTIPATKRALFFVNNTGSATLSIAVGSTTLTLATGSIALFQTDGTTNNLTSVIFSAPGQEVDIGFVYSGLPLNGQTINYPMNQALTLKAALAGSHFSVGTNPASTATYTLKKNGSSIGTIAISTGGVFTPTFASDVSFAAGDIFNIIAPSPQDTTLADVGLNFKFTK